MNAAASLKINARQPPHLPKSRRRAVVGKTPTCPANSPQRNRCFHWRGAG